MYNEENLHEAFKIFKGLAEQGDELSLNHLGEMYRSGLGVNYDAELAEECFRKAMKQGNTDAMVNLAKMQQCGEIIATPEEAQKWLEIAAGKSNIGAMRLLQEQKQAVIEKQKSEKIKGLLRLSSKLCK